MGLCSLIVLIKTPFIHIIGLKHGTHPLAYKFREFLQLILS